MLGNVKHTTYEIKFHQYVDVSKEQKLYVINKLWYTLESNWEKNIIRSTEVFRGSLADCAAWITLQQEGYDI